MKEVRMYTDGSCIGNPGPGGWCAILQCNGHEKVVAGGEAATTNNAMELIAILEGLRALKEAAEVRILTDSQLCIGWLENGWKRKDPKVRLLAGEIDAIVTTMGHDVKYEKVAAHADDKTNNRADAIARGEAERRRP